MNFLQVKEIDSCIQKLLKVCCCFTMIAKHCMYHFSYSQMHIRIYKLKIVTKNECNVLFEIEDIVLLLPTLIILFLIRVVVILIFSKIH